MQLPGDGKGSLPLELRKNLYQFSGAKTYAQLEHLNHLLYDKDGKLRPFNEYMIYARKLNRQYNINWLQAEWQTARTAAQMAEKWERIQETKDLFPNLEYRTVGDDRVRPSHQGLNGVIRPIDDDFWAVHYPPVDWRCRCDVVPTAANPTKLPEKLPEPTFKGNVGKDGEIFTKNHKFFRLINNDEMAKRNQELMKLNAPFQDYITRKGNIVPVSIFAHYVDPEFTDNLIVAGLIRDILKLKILIRPHILLEKYPNPEYSINGKIADRKSPLSTNLRGVLRKATKQNSRIVVIDLKDNDNSISDIIKQLQSNFRFDTNYETIQEVIIVSKDRRVVKHLMRSEIIKKGE